MRFSTIITRRWPTFGRRRIGTDGRAPARGGFTLLELIVVIAIIGVIAAMAVPSLKNAQKSNALASTSQQLIDHIALARRTAIKDRTTVAMVFLPPVKAADAGTYAGLSAGEQATLLRGQQSAYALYSFRQVGDQPGDQHPRYLMPWRFLPGGFFIPAWKFNRGGPATNIDATKSREQATLAINPFPWTGAGEVPVPSLSSPRQVKASLPYIAFGPTGSLQVQNNDGEFVDAAADEYIPIARGSVFLARDSADEKKLVWDAADIAENPANNSVADYHVIIIDRLTGRTRVARPEITTP